MSLSHGERAAQDATPPPHEQPRGSRHSVLRALRAAAFFLFVISCASLLLPSRAASLAHFNSTTPQPQRRTKARRRPARTATSAPARDYARFSHGSASHAARDCASCHRIASFAQPDIADFPDHPACIECHRTQFFRGARPAICSNCHTFVSPRAGARFNFPNPRAPLEFADVFPHADHIKSTSLIQFKKLIGEKSNIQTTCLYCHKVNAAKVTPPAPQVSGAGIFAPPPGTYMTTPTSHATCFQCHWQKGVADHEQEPYATQCTSCHRNIATSGATVAAVANVGAGRAVAPAETVARAAQRVVPAFLTSTARASVFPERVVPKFVHEIEAHKKRVNDEGKEVSITCLQCHAAARKAATLESLRLRENRVGLLSCSSSACHTAVSGAAQLPLSVYRELRERGKDAGFNCALCHTPPLSLNRDVPCSHYVAVYVSATKEKKGTKGIEQLTPPRCADDLKRAIP